MTDGDAAAGAVKERTVFLSHFENLPDYRPADGAFALARALEAPVTPNLRAGDVWWLSASSANRTPRRNAAEPVGFLNSTTHRGSCGVLKSVPRPDNR